MRIKIVGTYDYEDFEWDPDDATGLTEAAYTSLCDMLGEDGFEVAKIERPESIETSDEVVVTIYYEPISIEVDEKHELGVTDQAYTQLLNILSDNGISSITSWERV